MSDSARVLSEIRYDVDDRILAVNCCIQALRSIQTSLFPFQLPQVPQITSRPFVHSFNRQMVNAYRQHGLSPHVVLALLGFGFVLICVRINTSTSSNSNVEMLTVNLGVHDEDLSSCEKKCVTPCADRCANFREFIVTERVKSSWNSYYDDIVRYIRSYQLEDGVMAEVGIAMCGLTDHA